MTTNIVQPRGCSIYVRDRVYGIKAARCGKVQNTGYPDVRGWMRNRSELRELHAIFPNVA